MVLEDVKETVLRDRLYQYTVLGTAVGAVLMPGVAGPVLGGSLGYMLAQR